MLQKKIDIGTTHNVVVETTSAFLLTVVSPELKEGFFLMGHGLQKLPNAGDTGKIVFEKGGVMGGYWKFYPNKK